MRGLVAFLFFGLFLLSGCGDKPTAAQADANIRLGPDGLVERDKNKPLSTEARKVFREILSEKGVPLDDVRQICFYAEMFAFALVKPERDIKTYGMEEFWAGPEMSLKTGKADCEDHSMLFALLVADYKIEAIIVATDVVPESHSFVLVDGLGYMLFEIQRGAPFGKLTSKDGRPGITGLGIAENRNDDSKAQQIP